MEEDSLDKYGPPPLHSELCSTKADNRDTMEVKQVNSSGLETLNSTASLLRKE